MNFRTIEWPPPSIIATLIVTVAGFWLNSVHRHTVFGVMALGGLFVLCVWLGIRFSEKKPKDDAKL